MWEPLLIPIYHEYLDTENRANDIPFYYSVKGYQRPVWTTGAYRYLP
jgi:hypothetical protein